MASASVRLTNLARVAAGAIVVVYGLGALGVARGPGELTTYSGRSDLAAALAVIAGLALVASGIVTSFVRPAGRLGDLALLAGFVWFAPFWAGWNGGPPLVVSLGTLAAGFALPLLVHLVLASPTGGLRSTPARILIFGVYLEAVLVALGRALFRDPFFDPYCWNNCTDNVFLVHSSSEIAQWIRDADLWFSTVAAGAFASLCIWRLVAASSAARRMLWLVLVGGVALAGATIAHAVALDRMPLEDPGDRTFLSIFVAGSAAAIVIALGLVWEVLQARIQRRSVARIVAELGDAPPPGTLESALARALGDPELRISYWLPASQRYVDSRGRPLADPVDRPGHAATSLVRDGRRLALVTHAAGITELGHEFGAAVRLALENERLQAEVLAQLDDLRISRTRIIETADAERRRLERDLHDGAQQRLLALSYDLRLARASAEAAGDGETASLLTEATDEAQSALGELRELAEGIHPAILTEGGLAPALASLGDTARLAIELGDVVEERFPAAVETTAYLVVSDSVEDAERRGASYAAASVVRREQQLVVEVEDDGAERSATLIRLADRVGAIGGRLRVGRTTLQAQIPCG